jgi:predicted nucleic acid-binding protein
VRSLTRAIVANVFVLDASVAAKWFLSDEASSDADAVLKRAEIETAVAPSIFSLEIQNLLLSAERAGRIASQEVEDALDVLRDLPVRLVTSGDRFIPIAELALAREFDLSAYDAAYLACAEDLDLELVTADAPLEHAARSFGLRTAFVS